MIQVSRKDAKESIDSLLRRFSRKVQQAGLLAQAKQAHFYEKPVSKRDRRRRAINRQERRALKIQRLKLGQ